MNWSIDEYYQQITTLWNPSSPKINKHCKEITTELQNLCFQVFKFPSDNYHKYGIVDCCGCACGPFPQVSYKIMRIFALITLYLSIVDDACDCLKDVDETIRKELITHIQLVEKFEGQEEYFSRTHNPSIRLGLYVMDELFNSCSFFTQFQIRTLQFEMVKYFKTSLEMATYWADGSQISVEKCDQWRRIDSLGSIYMEMAKLQFDFVTTLEIEKFQRISNECFFLINDLASFPKELRDGTLVNHAICLQNETKQSTEQSFLMTIARLYDFLMELERMETCQVRNSIKEAMKGFGVWCLNSKRYKHPEHLISELKVEQISEKSSAPVNKINYLQILKANNKL